MEVNYTLVNGILANHWNKFSGQIRLLLASVPPSCEPHLFDAHHWVEPLTPNGLGILVLPYQTGIVGLADITRSLRKVGSRITVGAWNCLRAPYDMYSPRLIEESRRFIIFYGPGPPEFPLTLIHQAAYRPGEMNHLLANDLIMACTKVGETVLDPFGMSGVVAHEALLSRRKIVVLEQDIDCFEEIKRRCQRVSVEVASENSAGKGTKRTRLDYYRRGPREKRG